MLILLLFTIIILLIELIKARIYKCCELISTRNEKNPKKRWNNKLRQTMILDEKKPHENNLFKTLEFVVVCIFCNDC